MGQRVRVDVADQIATITLDRPEKRNAIDRLMRAELYDALTAASADPDVWVVVIQGAGGNFSTGHDLTESLEGSPSVGDLYALQHDMEKPLIAAISGACLAQGSGVALSCDIRLADQTAVFGWPQVKRGIGSISGPTLLARSVPTNVAMRLLLTGEPLPIDEAAALHLVEVVDDGSSVGESAQALARQIAANAPLAVRAMKQAVMATKTLSAIDAYRVASDILAVVEKTEDAQEGMRAFAEKRAPRWVGR